MPDLQGIVMHGALGGVVFCLVVAAGIHLAERWSLRRRPAPARAPSPSDAEVPALLCAVDAADVPLKDKIAVLERIRLRNDPSTALELLKLFTKENPTRLRREIMRTVWSVDQGVWTTTLLLEVVKRRDLAMMLRLDAAEILLHTGSEHGVAAVKHLLRLPGEDAGFKVRLLRLLDGSTDARCVSVVLGGLREEDGDVRAAALAVARRMIGEAGVRGELLRGAFTAGLRLSLTHMRHRAHMPTALRLLIETEEAGGPGAEAATVKLLLKILTLAPQAEEAAAMAAEGLGRLGVEEAVGELRRRIYGGSDLVRCKAVEALGRLGARDMIPDMGFIAGHDQLQRIRDAAAASAQRIQRRLP